VSDVVLTIKLPSGEAWDGMYKINTRRRRPIVNKVKSRDIIND
jgi:hypothetical protein